MWEGGGSLGREARGLTAARQVWCSCFCGGGGVCDGSGSSPSSGAVSDHWCSTEKSGSRSFGPTPSIRPWIAGDHAPAALTTRSTWVGSLVYWGGFGLVGSSHES